MLPLTPKEVLTEVAARARNARLAQDLTQAGLAARAGVSLSSLKRFERTGEIAFRSLVKIAYALRSEQDFEALFKAPEFETLDQALSEAPKRQRGRRN